MPLFDQNRNNEKIAKVHWQNIIYALTQLGDAKCGQIMTFVNNKARLDVESEFSSHQTKYSGLSRDQLNKAKEDELEDRELNRATARKWLKRMVTRGLVKTKKDVYSLTPQGRNEEIFGEYYGKLLYDNLMEMPFKGSLREKLDEYVRRVGIYVTYIFIRNSNRAGIKPQYSAVRNEYDEWVNDSISPVRLLEWFNNGFYSKSGNNNYGKLTKVLDSRFSKYIKNLETSEKMYYEKIFPFLHQHSMTMLRKREENKLDYT
jgi:predicted transcriptional regulator